MLKKSEVLQGYMKYHRLAETRVGEKIMSFNIHTYETNDSLTIDHSDVFKLKTLRSENGREYLSKYFPAI